MLQNISGSSKLYPCYTPTYYATKVEKILETYKIFFKAKKKFLKLKKFVISFGKGNFCSPKKKFSKLRKNYKGHS